MKHLIYIILKKMVVLLLVVPLFILTSCENTEPGEKVDKTVFMYFPWSTNLYDFFNENIENMQKCLRQNDIEDTRVVIFLASSSTEAQLFELRPNQKGRFLKKYKNLNNVAPIGLATLLEDVKHYSPSDEYSMVISSHGMGWLYVNRSRAGDSPLLKMRMREGGVPLTRYFGGARAQDQMDIEQLCEAIEKANMHMEFIMFDACYMANVEVAYALRNVCDYFVSSAAEIMAYGMPYVEIGESLLNGRYEEVCERFYGFYSEYSQMPCGTISVVDTKHLESLAAVMKKVNEDYEFDYNREDAVQELDGYVGNSIFYDMESYLFNLCGHNTNGGQADFNTVMSTLVKAVPYKKATSTFFTAITNSQVSLHTFCGITISDLSTHPYAADKVNTEWWKATH